MVLVVEHRNILKVMLNVRANHLIIIMITVVEIDQNKRITVNQQIHIIVQDLHQILQNLLFPYKLRRNPLVFLELYLTKKDHI